MDHWPEYDRYMQSPAWQTRRESYFARHLKRCAICKKERSIQLHHLDYKNLGREPDEDLVALCFTCHKAVHAYHRRAKSPSLRGNTNRYIKMRTTPSAERPRRRHGV